MVSGPAAEVLAGLRANEGRYYRNKYDHVFTVNPASEVPEVVDRVSRILKEERDIVIGPRRGTVEVGTSVPPPLSGAAGLRTYGAAGL